MKAEKKRRYPRALIFEAALAIPKGSSQSIVVSVCDVSLKGAQIVAPAQSFRGVEELDLLWTIVPGTAPLRLAAKLKHQNAIHSGLEFKSMRRKEALVLRALILIHRL